VTANPPPVSHPLTATHLAHLARRLGGLVIPRGPGSGDEAWVGGILTDAEHHLWLRMGRADRRQAVAGARQVARALGGDATSAVLAAALLHDVGKLDAGLGVYGRVVATLCGMVASAETIDDWRRSRGFIRRVGLYLQHPRLGREMLALAGSDPLTVAWAAEHHLPPDQWTIPRPIADVLDDADR